MSWTVFPRIYTNLKSKFCFQFCFQVRRSVISTIVDPYMSFYEKWEIITEIFDSWKFKMSVFFYFWKNYPKNGQNFQLFTLYSKGNHFSITKLDILIFNWNRSLKFELKKENFYINLLIKVLWKTPWMRYQKKWNNIFNGPFLKTAYLWNFYFH